MATGYFIVRSGDLFRISIIKILAELILVLAPTWHRNSDLSKFYFSIGNTIFDVEFQKCGV